VSVPASVGAPIGLLSDAELITCKRGADDPLCSGEPQAPRRIAIAAAQAIVERTRPRSILAPDRLPACRKARHITSQHYAR
jgi:hypothetical protein